MPLSAFSVMSPAKATGTASSGKIASHGHSGAQAPQSMHWSGFDEQLVWKRRRAVARLVLDDAFRLRADGYA